MRQMMNVSGLMMLLGVLIVSCGSSSNNKDAANAETGGDPKAAAANDTSQVGTSSVTTACQVDTDCVKDKCCHAAACVSASSAKDCSEAMCTEECKEGTMDCGKGSCGCVDGECAVKWAN
jgi:hypothetical protein